MPDKYKLKPINQKEQERRESLRPEELVDALNDRVHREVGKSRAARTNKRPRDEN